MNMLQGGRRSGIQEQVGGDDFFKSDFALKERKPNKSVDRFIPSKIEKKLFTISPQKEENGRAGEKAGTHPDALDFNKQLDERRTKATFRNILESSLIMTEGKSFNKTPKENRHSTDRKLLSFSSVKKKGSSIDDDKDFISFEKKEKSLPKYRKIECNPTKVLDAPGMEDDFYRQVLDWTANNEILVGLDNSLYAWSPETNTISVLFCCSDKNEKISAIRACLKGEFVYFGTTEGNLFAVHIRSKEPVVIAGGFGKISCLDTSGNLLAIGCQKKNLVLLDIKSGKQTLIFQHFDISPKESCGVKFCHQGMYLAAGSNDNRFLVVQLSTMQLVVNCLEHKSAIRAIAWSRANSNLVASGGGLADKSIIFWNVKTGKIERKIQTDSQVCGLEFSKCSNELLSTHGFSKNNIQVWELDGNEKIAELLGHSNRVLYHALNPDGSTLVTSSADQTLRFWEVFPKQAEPRSHKSLFQNLMILR